MLHAEHAGEPGGDILPKLLKPGALQRMSSEVSSIDLSVSCARLLTSCWVSSSTHYCRARGPL